MLGREILVYFVGYLVGTYLQCLKVFDIRHSSNDIPTAVSGCQQREEFSGMNFVCLVLVFLAGRSVDPNASRRLSYSN